MFMLSLPSFLVYVCVCSCTYPWVCVQGQRRTLLSFCCHPASYLLRTVSLNWTWISLLQLKWLAQELSGFTCLHLPILGLQSYVATPSFFVWVLGFELIFCLLRKFSYPLSHFPNSSSACLNTLYKFMTLVSSSLSSKAIFDAFCIQLNRTLDHILLNLCIYKSVCIEDQMLYCCGLGFLNLLHNIFEYYLESD